MTAGPVSPEPFDLVLFDCDGVLVDSERISVRVDQRVLADLGREPEVEEIVHAKCGGPVEDSAYGLQAARAAGMHALACLRVRRRVTPADRLAGPGTTVFSDMRQLPDLLAAGRPC